MSINRQIGKENMEYTYNEILLFSFQKKAILKYVTTWMNLENIISRK